MFVPSASARQSNVTQPALTRNVPPRSEVIVRGLKRGSVSPHPEPQVSYLTHASDPRHNGVVKEVEFLPRLAKEEVNLVVVAHGVADRLTLLDVSRADENGVCQKGNM